MTNARDLLAAELEANGGHESAAAIRRAETDDSAKVASFFIPSCCALRAIEKALSLPTFTQGVEAAAEVAEQRPEDGEECSRAYRHEVGRDIAAAIRSLTPSDPWKDIGSAPRDGTAFMVWAPGMEFPEVVRWFEYSDHEKAETEQDGYFHYAEELLRDVTDDCCMDERTHWLPLPPPPASPTASSEDENDR